MGFAWRAFLFFSRRDLLDISPTLTEAAGAIVDVSFVGIFFVFKKKNAWRKLFFEWKERNFMWILDELVLIMINSSLNKYFRHALGWLACLKCLFF